MANLHKLALLIPMDKIEQGAQTQIYDLLKLPFLKKLAIMPDCHQGYTMPIGGVGLFDGVISSDCVGFDIGCGMCLLNTGQVPELPWPMDDRMAILDKLEQLIPVGFHNHQDPRVYPDFKSASGDKDLNKKVNDRLHWQLGTLGSGK